MLVHVAIVSDQLLPTVIPCLMHRPERVLLVTSRSMAVKADRLRHALEREGFRVEIRGAAPDAGLDRIRAYARMLADELTTGQNGDEVVFNATGGTKLMTLGFVDGFRERATRIIYTDTAHGRIEVIADRRQADPQPMPMHDVLDVPRYLAVQGFRYAGDATRDAARLARSEARRDASRFLASRAAGLSGLIALLNALAHCALEKRSGALVQPEQHLNHEPRGEVSKALALFERAGLLTRKGPQTVRFADAEAAWFLGGGWLEEYAFAEAKHAGLHDVRLGVTGVWDGATAARNEFDVLACDRNRLLFIECKTLRFTGDENDNELAYKVDSLGKVTRGLLGETWLLTAQKPTQVLCDRATQAGFRLIGPRFLGSLSRWVRMWKDGRPQS